ncbi:MAG TPA: GGDEF domain-containing protein [Sphingomonas sp.]|nr:GGDEF domain-containing protein [Sphingomonas sp.]
MAGSTTAEPWPENGLFERVGRFLSDQRLSHDPAHYAFAFAIVSAPDGPLAKRVAALTQGGIRLTRDDIERLGGRVVDGSPLAELDRATEPRAEHPDSDAAAAMVVETQHRVDDFVQIVRTIQAETHGFGVDLARSAAGLTKLAEIDEITALTSRMIARVHDSEVRLAAATAEADSLRAKLAEAHDTARRDVLTGLPNRRAFEEAFAARDIAAGPHCLVLCDIDRFKRVNDHHGHPVGDRVLTAIGQALTAECAPHLVVRHGGEEFAMLLSGMRLAEAGTLLDSVRATVAAKRFRNRETNAALGIITFSAGVTAIGAEEAAETAFLRADRLLYRAKNEGRDRVCVG